VDEDLERTQRLIGEARHGRAGALDELLGDGRAALERALELRVPSRLRARLDVSDVVQDALVDAFAHLDTFEPRGAGSFRAWLRRIAENRLKMAVARHLGTERRGAQHETTIRSGAQEPLGAATSPSSLAGRGERRDLIHAALEELSDEHRAVIQLVRFDGLSIAQVAQRMGRSENAVKKLQARALIELERRLPPGARP
jgi:RNA polymerase sigma-70 factor (ECF subfamily)